MPKRQRSSSGSGDSSKRSSSSSSSGPGESAAEARRAAAAAAAAAVVSNKKAAVEASGGAKAKDSGKAKVKKAVDKSRKGKAKDASPVKTKTAKTKKAEPIEEKGDKRKKEKKDKGKPAKQKDSAKKKKITKKARSASAHSSQDSIARKSDKSAGDRAPSAAKEAAPPSEPEPPSPVVPDLPPMPPSPIAPPSPPALLPPRAASPSASRSDSERHLSSIEREDARGGVAEASLSAKAVVAQHEPVRPAVEAAKVAPDIKPVVPQPAHERKKVERAPKADVPHEVEVAGPIPSMLISQLDRGKAPCELPLWCVAPNYEDIEREVEILRVMSKGGSVSSRSRRLLPGRRPWILLGRRDKQSGGIEPDVGLGSTRASRKHAVILQNWKGQVFLMDLGSSHGSYLGNKKCPPHKPCEWKVDVVAHFADKSGETFKLQASTPDVAVAASSTLAALAPAAPVAPWLAVVPASNGRHHLPLAPGGGPDRHVQRLAEKHEDEADAPPASQNPAAPLYPGEWEVPADGISEFYGQGGAKGSE